MNQLILKCQKALITVDKYYDAALQHVRGELIVDGKLSRDNLDKEQHAAHGLSWIAAYRATLKEMVNWAENLDILENTNSSKPQITKARNDLQKNISNSLAMFDNKKFFRNDEFSVLDAVIIPILLRLDYHQIKIPNNKASKPLFDYIERMQDLPSVKESFTSLEIELL